MSRRTQKVCPVLEPFERRALTSGLAPAVPAAAAVPVRSVHAEHRHPVHHLRPHDAGQTIDLNGGHVAAPRQTIVSAALLPLSPLLPGSCFRVSDDIGQSGQFHWGPGQTQFFSTRGTTMYVSVNGSSKAIPTTSTHSNAVPVYGVTITPAGFTLALQGYTAWKDFSVSC